MVGVSGSIPLARTMDSAQAIQMALSAELVFVCGIPGTGKSLFMRELFASCRRAGRQASMLQWDVARRPFDEPAILAAYPEIDGSTHIMIRRAAGLWALDAVSKWRAARSASDVLLIEAPLIGGRFIEFAHPAPNELETLLRSPRAQFWVVTPSVQVRRAIEAARRAESVQPRHTYDGANAMPSVVDALWSDIVQAALELGVCPDAVQGGTAPAYSPDLYFDVYRRVLGARHAERLEVSEILANETSPHDIDGRRDLAPSPQQARSSLRAAEIEGVEAAATRAQFWYRAL